jgi:hypothetical protein
LIITNLKDLKVHHLNFDDLVERFTIEKFLTIPNFEIIKEKYKARHIVLIIDEAQKYLDSKFYDKDVFYFFQFHRHIGLDIFLLTQSVSTICRQLPPLCEFLLKACPRSKGIVGSFRYKFTDGKGLTQFSKAIRKRQQVFAMYQSFSSDEVEKPKNVLTHWIVMLAVVSIVVIIGFKGFFYAYAHKSEKSRIIQAPKPAALLVAPRVPANINPPVPAPVGAVVPVPVAAAAQPILPALVAAVPTIPLGAPASFVPNLQKLPSVVGFVTEMSGKRKYLLSTGQSIYCKRELSVGDYYIR